MIRPGFALHDQRLRHKAVSRPANLSALASLEICSEANVFFSSSVNWSENNPCTSASVARRFAPSAFAWELWLSIPIACSNIHTPDSRAFRGGDSRLHFHNL